ncbi:MAG: YfcE family phosphodiesterase [Deltaproteobacteria bacterium HGW-Deltaproteobacteria-21]|nr:MAG: YfcE family phosphodiesterase [Deltaproteobacteria bacterium HGW-Deltaproteobacteria-21]
MVCSPILRPSTRLNVDRIGVISDTHGLLRTSVIDALDGVSLIIHAGDIGSKQVLTELRKIAPLVAVRGNVDKGPWTRRLRLREYAEVAGTACYVVHDIADLDLDPSSAGIRVVIHGHSHKPRILEKGGVMYLNPGSVGPKRFKLPVSMAYLYVRDKGSVSAEILHLKEE